MDFGVVSHNQTSPTEAPPLGSTEQPRNNNNEEITIVNGSVNLKHQRSELPQHNWRLPKMPRSETSESFAAFGRSNLWPSTPDDGQKMLSFSSPHPHSNAGMNDNGSTRSIAFSICQDENYSRAGGIHTYIYIYIFGFFVGSGVRGAFGRLKGPFTPSQWMELEHQALIYKHLVANVPVPSNLLVPLKRSLYSYGSPGSYASNFLGWGPFHLGYSGSNDPEPGRCRRTDGKKWRCSRDAVPDQKYCERHINRGRHRSRKPVEGQTGHAVSGSKVTSIASSSKATVVPSNSASNSHQFNPLQQSNTANASNSHHLAKRALGFQGPPLISPSTGLKPKDAPFTIQKQHVQFEELSHSEFGLVSSDSLLNPTERISYMNTTNSDSFLAFNEKEANDPHPVHHFIDDWPKNHSNRASGSTWPEELKSDWTQLSMSITDFSSSVSSPAQEKSTISTLRLSNELDHIHMSLGMGHDMGDLNQKQPSWFPISWGNSMGGPLGEVLTSTASSSPQLGSSPTGVLQKATFVTLSNSSSGGSPHSAENKKGPENSSHCNGVLGSALLSSAAIPSL
ncbi:hypothetical protein BUALT_Bualt04G0097500 [Buddleja alternifolia]|uniref:Growth-regulating factor n=1 Tax=Buddleja alternifolia TaxID=168488 RepID=A0AAV6XVT7_9LAMI|nr:hypothetical protein BUALT_Bualt04G0097500 [Buddleja alternifolia]